MSPRLTERHGSLGSPLAPGRPASRPRPILLETGGVAGATWDGARSTAFKRSSETPAEGPQGSGFQVYYFSYDSNDLMIYLGMYVMLGILLSEWVGYALGLNRALALLLCVFLPSWLVMVPVACVFPAGEKADPSKPPEPSPLRW